MIRIARTLSTWATRWVNSGRCGLHLSRCVLCLARAGRTGLCEPCLQDLPANHTACERCALPLTAPNPQRLCSACLLRSPAQDFCLTPWRYEFPIDQMIRRYKYDGWRAPGRALALNWADQVTGTLPEIPQALIPAPIAPERLPERGFSQTAEIADWISRETGTPLETGLLQRHPGYQPQAGLDRGKRRRNLQGAFYVTTRTGMPEHVAIVEDVITTGASGDAMAACLREAGIRRVDLWALARTP
ncbi:ComF family protein [Halospina denitrificans]|uniref:ComF family protein n=1 Tax=Halospina denitrificans TaxID=332522 RepID=A0A4R7K0B2_9GAMM|nr:ComF family protein [Halospina denitrificans]TDT43283.1 ComF family protein [Halospina denitrificans]